MSASFILSAASAADFPQTGLPEVALLGRSNVGKSSLINALVQASIARTSAAPGKTRLANYYLIDLRSPRGSFYLVDLPGYGYARGGSESARTFETLVAQYFDRTEGRRIAGVLHLIDARHPAMPQDGAAHAWLRRTGLPIAVVPTKMDKLTNTERTKTLALLARQYEAALLPESVPEHEGMDAIWKLIRRWAVSVT